MKTLGVKVTGVAGVEPAATRRFRGRVLARPVSGHQVLALIQNLADLVGWQVFVFGVHHAHAAAEHRPAAGQQPLADVVFMTEGGLREAAFEGVERATSRSGEIGAVP